MPNDLITTAATNIQDILTSSIKIEPKDKVLVIYDTNYELTNILSEGYRIALNNLNHDAEFLDFDSLIVEGKESIINRFNELNERDIVVLIQSTNFRLDDFRIRLHLFTRKLKVIEHMHLHRNKPEVFDVYINSLKYDNNEQSWYQTMATRLVQDLSTTNELNISYKDASLTVNQLEIPKINIGDYTGMDNIGGTFPIGEVFTEAKDFTTMSGSIYIYAFANREFNISYYDPFRLDITNGIVTGYGDNTPAEFIDVLDLIKTYERPLIREIGFGLNRAMTKARPLGDITAFERILGMHMSLGEKHSVYKKPGITVHKTKFHVDLFLSLDNVNISMNGKHIQLMDAHGYNEELLNII
jgi:aminopeptidase